MTPPIIKLFIEHVAGKLQVKATVLAGGKVYHEATEVDRDGNAQANIQSWLETRSAVWAGQLGLPGLQRNK